MKGFRRSKPIERFHILSLFDKGEQIQHMADTSLNVDYGWFELAGVDFTSYIMILKFLTRTLTRFSSYG